jgi:hypothetical protein
MCHAILINVTSPAKTKIVTFTNYPQQGLNFHTEIILKQIAFGVVFTKNINTNRIVA